MALALNKYAEAEERPYLMSGLTCVEYVAQITAKATTTLQDGVADAFVPNSSPLGRIEGEKEATSVWQNWQNRNTFTWEIEIHAMDYYLNYTRGQ